MATRNITDLKTGDKIRWGVGEGDDRHTVTADAFAVAEDEIVVNCTMESDGQPYIRSGRPDVTFEVPGW